MKKIMVAWVAYQRRADCMKDYWGYELNHIHTKYAKSSWQKPLDYLIKTFKTISLILRKKPDELWIQLPPSFLLHIAIIYKKLFNKNCKIIADLHNSMLRDKWIKFPFALNLLNKVDAVLAHNSTVAEELTSIGVSPAKIRVLEDFPFQYPKKHTAKIAHPKQYIIFPCSFDVDEPIWTVIEAAHKINIDVYITGNVSKLKIKNQSNLSFPENVKFTGYLSKPEYEELLLNSAIVLGMTTRQNVQLSVANEGLSASKPLILSDTKTLRELYGDAALFVSNETPDDLVNKINYALLNSKKMSQMTDELLVRRIEKWKNQASKVYAL